MPRTSCLGCLFTSVFLVVVFTVVISFIVSSIFGFSAFEDLAFPVTMSGVVGLMMKHKTLLILSMLVSIFPTFIAASHLRDKYDRVRTQKEKEAENLMRKLNEDRTLKTKIARFEMPDDDDDTEQTNTYYNRGKRYDDEGDRD